MSMAGRYLHCTSLVIVKLGVVPAVCGSTIHEGWDHPPMCAVLIKVSVVEAVPKFFWYFQPLVLKSELEMKYLWTDPNVLLYSCGGWDGCGSLLLILFMWKPFNSVLSTQITWHVKNESILWLPHWGMVNQEGAASQVRKCCIVGRWGNGMVMDQACTPSRLLLLLVLATVLHALVPFVLLPCYCT